MWGHTEIERGLDALRRGRASSPSTRPSPRRPAPTPCSPRPTRRSAAASATRRRPPRRRTPATGGAGGDGPDDADLATSSEDDEAERSRLIALVELARGGRHRGVRPALRPLPAVGLPLPLLPDPLGGPGRGPDLGDLLPGAAQHEHLPLAGQGLRRLADDHRAQPHHRPLQGRSHPAGDDHRGHEPPRRRHRGSRGRGARRASPTRSCSRRSPSCRASSASA